ncbi:MAG: prolyl oligopeptidase family serine peptidase [Balneolaceae bacterium]
MLLSCTGTSDSTENKSQAELNKISYMSSATGEERDYFVYLPEGYHENSDQKWPVLLFLHGNGERGNAKDELDYVLIHGPLYEAWIQKRDLPFVMIVPQLPMYGMDEEMDYIRNRTVDDIPKRLEEGVPPRPEEFPTPQPMTGTPENKSITLPPEGPPVGWFMLEEDLITILDHTLSNYNGDAERIYLTGISYGGFGTWYMASKYPERFAAIAPVVGYGHPDLMRPIAENQLPVWCFAGGRDPVVPVEFFYPGLNELENLGHTNVLFTNHEDMGHDAWRRIYAGRDIYDWLLSHSK